MLWQWDATRCKSCGLFYYEVSEAMYSKPMPVIVIDTETGGLDPAEHSILSIGLVTDTDELDVPLIREPALCTTPKAMEVNGIDLTAVAQHGVSVEDACEAVDTFLKKHMSQHEWGLCVMAGHNITFDMGFLKRLYRLAGRPFARTVPHRTVDTHTLLFSLWQAGKLPADALKSDGAFAHFNLPVGQAGFEAHTAIGDARLTYALLRHLWGML